MTQPVSAAAPPSVLLADRLGGLRVRARPGANLISFASLRTEDRGQFGSLTADRRLYGAWHHGRGSLKVIDHETAELLTVLAQPRFTADLTADATSLVRLILDGLLEVEVSDGFVHSIRAYEFLWQPHWQPATATFTAQLSMAALRYADRLEVEDARRLSARLYFYGRFPVSPGWLARFPDRRSVERFVGASGRGATARRLTRWKRVKPDPNNDGWLLWVNGSRKGTRGTGRYKLYISPRPEDSPAGFAAAVQVADDAGAEAFKVGHDPTALLRPDKIVLYFADFESLTAAASAASDLLRGYRGHGVPFTAELEASGGLVSWGVDPPRSESLVGWQERESWRLWLTNQLATSMLAARGAGGKVEPWLFAAARVELDGVDTSTWTPRNDPWVADL